ncbi:hypothetical protein D1627_13615 [Pontibacter oryzae]|uniref:ABC transporter ATP-binding protein n=1 Tax=Pontibacter oryzae TaxID=2304593 RepID=A0A399S2S8_9BACT|nr:hypothetical protein D1627_13615 [Pontibacter oryzae]
MGIEPLFVEEIKVLLQEARCHKGIILTDHNYHAILEVSDRIILLHDGSCKHIESPDELEAWNYLPAVTL